MIVLRIAPNADRLNDCYDLMAFLVEVILLDACRYLFGDLKLLGGMGENTGTIF